MNAESKPLDGAITVEILRSIRDEIAALRKDTNERFDHANERLDFLAQGQIRMANDLDGLREELHEVREELREELHEVRGELAKQGSRFDHFLDTAGSTLPTSHD